MDLKVLARSFNCESRACYAGNPRESFFSSSPRKLDIIRLSLYTLQLVKGYDLLPPGVRQENGTAP